MAPIEDARAVELVRRELDEHVGVVQQLRERADDLVALADLLASTFEAGGQLLLFGNGGSAADAQHVAAEFVGRFERERHPLPAIALSTDTSALTALGNDYGFATVFTRQVQALARPGDAVVGISTSGRSANVLAALELAASRGCRTVLLTGDAAPDPSPAIGLVLRMPSARTARIQEAHILTWHVVAGLVEERLPRA